MNNGNNNNGNNEREIRRVGAHHGVDIMINSIEIFSGHIINSIRGYDLADPDIVEIITRHYLNPQLVDFLDNNREYTTTCLLYTSPSPRDQRGSRMPSSA